MQVHGGMGYIEETGAAQHLRDARIAAIYEGTNGIQAIDLVTRKLPLAGGATVKAMIGELKRTVDAVNAGNDPAFGWTGTRLQDAVESLERTTQWLLGGQHNDLDTALAGATPYLRLFALAAGGAFLAEEALAASEACRQRRRCGRAYRDRALLCGEPGGAGRRARAYRGRGRRQRQQCGCSIGLAIMPLRNHTLFITGASRGIGLAIALRAARDGANIAIAAKTDTPHPKLPGTIFTAAEEIAAAGGTALPLAVDVRDEEQVKAAIEQTVATFGGIDVVVNNASAVSRTPLADTDMRRFDLMHQVNTRGTFMVSKYAIPHLAKAKNPHILMNSPPLDFREKWFAGSTGYSIAKYGMSLVALGLAGELRSAGIAVNTLWPRTTIATAAIKNLLGGDRVMRMSRKPEIMADAAYLIFQKPAKSFTGNFLIDDTFLAGEGVTDFEQYRVDPSEPLAPTFFVPDDPPPPPGVSVAGVRWE